jgi:hypothetical protein
VHGEGNDQFGEPADQQVDAEQGRSDEDRWTRPCQHHDTDHGRQQTGYQHPFLQPLRCKRFHGDPRSITDGREFDAALGSPTP